MRALLREWDPTDQTGQACTASWTWCFRACKTRSPALVKQSTAFTSNPVVNIGRAAVKYTELSGPGALMGGWKMRVPSGDADDFKDKSGDIADAELDRWCVSRALYSSEDPGEVDVEAVLSVDSTGIHMVTISSRQGRSQTPATVGIW